tara:strand:- start:245 stop:349 length:105 start_codon:yes stop_codon:yes gene_type:complete
MIVIIDFIGSGSGGFMVYCISISLLKVNFLKELK